MKINLKNMNPGTWFGFDEGGGEICLRVCPRAEIARIRKAAVKKKVDYRRGQRFEYEDTDEVKYDEMLWTYCITDWRELIDEDDNEILCTNENKVLLMSHSVAFASFVGEKLIELTDLAISREASAEEN